MTTGGDYWVTGDTTTVPVDVDAPLGHVPQRHVGQQQRRVAGGVERAVNFRRRPHTPQTAPTGSTGTFVVLSIRTSR